MALALCLFSQSGGFLALLHSLTPTPGLFLTAFSPLFTAPINVGQLATRSNDALPVCKGDCNIDKEDGAD